MYPTLRSRYLSLSLAAIKFPWMGLSYDFRTLSENMHHINTTLTAYKFPPALDVISKHTREMNMFAVGTHTHTHTHSLRHTNTVTRTHALPIFIWHTYTHTHAFNVIKCSILDCPAQHTHTHTARNVFARIRTIVSTRTRTHIRTMCTQNARERTSFPRDCE